MLPICIGDNIELCFNLYSLRGLVDISSVQWQPAKLTRTSNESMLQYNVVAKLAQESDRTRKVFADLSRICEVEDSVNDWRDFASEPNPPWNPPLDVFKPLFTICHIEYSQVDLTVLKIYLHATQRGTLYSPL